VLLLELYQEKIQKQSLMVMRFREHVVSKKLENIKTEIFLKAMLINRFLTMNNY